jgi:hypothetical protein
VRFGFKNREPENGDGRLVWSGSLAPILVRLGKILFVSVHFMFDEISMRDFLLLMSVIDVFEEI